MPLISFTYRFSVNLPASADDAYRWAVDYRPDDWTLMGEVGRRRIQKVAEGTIILTDTVERDGRSVTKKRLVRLWPARRSWTNTHLAGPTLHSQFWYSIVPRGPRRSRIEFVGLQVEPSARPLSASQLARRASAVRREDAALWRRLARAMGHDLGPRRRRR